MLEKLENTEAEALEFFRNRKRTLLRGIIAGLFVSIFLVFFSALMVGFLRTPIVDLFSLDDTRSTMKGAWSEADWYIIPAFAFLMSFAKGLAIAIWAPPKSRILVWVYLAITLPLAFSDPLPDANTPMKLAIWGLTGALGLVLGNEAYHWYERRTK